MARIGNHGGIFTIHRILGSKISATEGRCFEDVVAEMQAGWTLTSARNDLMHAGSEWGGFGERAIENINHYELWAVSATSPDPIANTREQSPPPAISEWWGLCSTAGAEKLLLSVAEFQH